MDRQSPIEEIGDNWSPMDFCNPQNEERSFWNMVFPHTIHNHTHKMSKADCEDLEKLSFMTVEVKPHGESKVFQRCFDDNNDDI